MKTFDACFLAASLLFWTTALGAPPPGPDAASIQQPALNLTLPFNRNKANRPSDPYEYRASGSKQMIIFSSYGADVAFTDIRECLILAHLDVSGHKGTVYQWKHDLEYSSDGLALKMDPSEWMTWTMWQEAITGILNFSKNQFAGTLKFAIMQDGTEGVAGNGSIVVDL